MNMLDIIMKVITGSAMAVMFLRCCNPLGGDGEHEHKVQLRYIYICFAVIVVTGVVCAFLKRHGIK